jgi:hypothetical protein
MVYNGTNWLILQTECWPKPSVAQTEQPAVVATDATQLIVKAKAAEFGTTRWESNNPTMEFESITQNNTKLSCRPWVGYQLKWYVSTACGTNTDTTFVAFTPSLMHRDSVQYPTTLAGRRFATTEDLKSTIGLAGTGFLVADSVAGTRVYVAQYESADGASAQLCPDGWRLPNREEWAMLLTEKSYVVSVSSFSGRHQGGQWLNRNEAAIYWVADDWTTTATAIEIHRDSNHAFAQVPKDSFAAVRCIHK